MLGLKLCVLSAALNVSKLLYFSLLLPGGTGRTIVPNLMNNGPTSAQWRVVAKSRENMVLGSLEQAIPEGFRNLSRFARSGFGGQNEADRCRSPPPDHRSRCGLEGRLIGFPPEDKELQEQKVALQSSSSTDLVEDRSFPEPLHVHDKSSFVCLLCEEKAVVSGGELLHFALAPSKRAALNRAASKRTAWKTAASKTAAWKTAASKTAASKTAAWKTAASQTTAWQLSLEQPSFQTKTSRTELVQLQRRTLTTELSEPERTALHTELAELERPTLTSELAQLKTSSFGESSFDSLDSPVSEKAASTAQLCFTEASFSFLLGGPSSKTSRRRGGVLNTQLASSAWPCTLDLDACCHNLVAQASPACPGERSLQSLQLIRHSIQKYQKYRYFWYFWKI